MCNLWLFLLIIPNIITSSIAFIQNPKQSLQQETISYRLPNNTFPEHYTIHLKTNVHEEDFSFTGEVKITVVTRTETTFIVVHARQLVIGEVSLWNTLTIPTEIGIHPIEYDPITEFVTIRLLNGFLPSNERFLLIIAYNGELREDNLGFYRSSYRDADNRLV